MKFKTVTISTLNYFRRKKLPILIIKAKISIFAIKEINITIIDSDAYYATCKLKRS